jgi:2-C-methyl-D-erythritol 2,4-cyclodiphosphate synthase
MRVGVGYDSHRFDESRPLVLAGVTIPGHAGLAGHSDADLVAHAVTDALLGAAGLGDIGTHFPPADEHWRDADSMELLRLALHEVEAANYRVVNVDVTVICETPKLAPHIEAMRGRLGERLGIAPGHVSIKGKTNEGLGWIGRGEGAAAIAVALIDRLAE